MNDNPFHIWSNKASQLVITCGNIDWTLHFLCMACERERLWDLSLQSQVFVFNQFWIPSRDANTPLVLIQRNSNKYCLRNIQTYTKKWHSLRNWESEIQLRMEIVETKNEYKIHKRQNMFRQISQWYLFHIRLANIMGTDTKKIHNFVVCLTCTFWLTKIQLCFAFPKTLLFYTSTKSAYEMRRISSMKQ